MNEAHCERFCASVFASDYRRYAVWAKRVHLSIRLTLEEFCSPKCRQVGIDIGLVREMYDALP